MPENRFVFGKRIVDEALPHLTPEENLAVRVIAELETNYGRGWKPPGTNSNNWGAVTMAPLSKNEDGTVNCPANGFMYGDSRFDEKTGKVVKYKTCFRIYPSPHEGAQHLAEIMLKENVRDAIARHDIEGISRAMRVNSYYKGEKPFEEAIAEHHLRFKNSMARVLANTGEADPFLQSNPTGGPDTIPPGQFPPNDGGSALKTVFWWGVAGGLAWLAVRKAKKR